MPTPRFGRRLLSGVGGAGLIAMGVLTAACGGNGGQSPSSTTTPTTTSVSPTSTSASATEKSINPTGGNLFTPPVTANPAPNVQGGQHPGLNGVS